MPSRTFNRQTRSNVSRHFSSCLQYERVNQPRYRDRRYNDKLRTLFLRNAWKGCYQWVLKFSKGFQNHRSECIVNSAALQKASWFLWTTDTEINSPWQAEGPTWHMAKCLCEAATSHTGARGHSCQMVCISSLNGRALVSGRTLCSGWRRFWEAGRSQLALKVWKTTSRAAQQRTAKPAKLDPKRAKHFNWIFYNPAYKSHPSHSIYFRYFVAHIFSCIILIYKSTMSVEPLWRKHTCSFDVWVGVSIHIDVHVDISHLNTHHISILPRRGRNRGPSRVNI